MALVCQKNLRGAGCKKAALASITMYRTKPGHAFLRYYIAETRLRSITCGLRWDQSNDQRVIRQLDGGKSNAINTCHDDVFSDVFLHADSVATDSAASAGKSPASASYHTLRPSCRRHWLKTQDMIRQEHSLLSIFKWVSTIQSNQMNFSCATCKNMDWSTWS